MTFHTQYRWNGEIVNQTLEDEYSSNTRPSSFKTIRIACMLTATAYLGGAVANYITFGPSKPFVIIAALRISAFIAALVCTAATRRTASQQKVDHLILLYFAILVIGDSVELFFTPESSLPELPGLLVIVLVYYMFYPTRLHLMIAGGLFAGISYSTTAGLVHGTGAPLFANSIISFMLINGFGIYHVRTMNRVQRKTFIALRSEKELNAQLQKEIAERKKIEQKLFEQATIDALTNAYNRRYFMELAHKEFSRSSRHGRPMALIAMDLDHFKRVNDNYGHDMGDRVLQAVSAQVRESLREEDLMGRLGGEEFAMLLPDTDQDGAMKMAERIRKAIDAEPVRGNGIEVRITASFGIAAGLSGPKSDLPGQLKAADDALYAAKHNGRNQVITGAWG